MNVDELLKMLVCPKCRHKLELPVKGEGFLCPSCQVVYPVRENIPVLLIDEAIPATQWHADEGKG